MADVAGIARRRKAIAQVERWVARHHCSLRVSYTLPGQPTGLESDGIKVLSMARSYSARVDVVNIMTFDCYDDAPHNMLEDAESAGSALVGQLRVGVSQRAWHFTSALKSFTPDSSIPASIPARGT